MTPDDFDKLRLSPERLAELVREELRIVAECLREEPHTNWMPKLQVLTVDEPGGKEKRTIYVLDVDFNEADEKRPLLEEIGRRVCAARELPLAVFLSSEAWLSQHTHDAAGQRQQPRHDPKRREVIMVMALSLGRAAASAFLAVLRDGDNHLVPGEPSEVITERCRVPLLECFYGGFLRAALSGRN